MAGNPFDNPKMSMMYQDALQSLYAGVVMPWERDILAIAPLPADVVDPFASQDVDPLQIMGFTHNSLVTWIDEARKANYFSKRFTDLSKLVLKGVMTMGRGLITLHNRGEDLSRAPMQIGDLISVGSYHFRKSYLGVIQTAKSHPEISERLLVNQLSWTNMLLRLYKTKEKLAENKKSEIRNKISSSNEEVRMKNEEVPDGNSENSSFLPHNSSLDDDSSFLPHNSSLDDDSSFLPLHSSSDNGSPFDKDDVHPFSEVDALFEPAALSAPRALKSLDQNKKSEIRNKKSNSGVSGQVSGVGSQISGGSDQGSEAHGDCPHVVAKSTHGTVTSDALIPANEEEAENKKSETSANKKSEIRNKKSSDDEDVQTTNHYPLTTESDSSFLPLHSSLDDDSSFEDDLPPYLRILRQAFGRSEPNEEGRVTFTYDEIRYLASNPDFARIYPETAADMRKIQQQIDTG